MGTKPALTLQRVEQEAGVEAGSCGKNRAHLRSFFEEEEEGGEGDQELSRAVCVLCPYLLKNMAHIHWKIQWRGSNWISIWKGPPLCKAEWNSWGALPELTDRSRESRPRLCIWVGNHKGYRNKRTVPELPILEMQPDPQHPTEMNLLLSLQSPAVTHEGSRSFPDPSPLGWRVWVEQLQTPPYICSSLCIFVLFCFVFHLFVFPWESAHFAWRLAQSRAALVSNGNPAGSSQDVLFPLYGLLTWERGPGHNARASREAHSDNGLCVKGGTD